MKLQYCSDLHLEFTLNERFMRKHPLDIMGDILLLAGDIVPFTEMNKHQDFFSFVADHFSQTYWIPGNHEYYHGDISERSGSFQEKIRDNVTLINNQSVVHWETDLIFSTLWSQLNLADDWQLERSLSDFHVIKNQGAGFSPAAFNELHADSLVYLQKAVARSAAKHKVVVTHHVPTYRNYPPKYMRDLLSQAFTTELAPFIEASGIHSWLYGHHHAAIADFKIGGTNLLTNQLGYVKHGEHLAFKRDAVVLLD